MGLLERQAREIPYDDDEPNDPVLRQDPEHPNRYTYSSPAVPLLRVRLERGMRSTYGWEITYEACTCEQALAVIRQTDLALRAEYGAER